MARNKRDSKDIEPKKKTTRTRKTIKTTNSQEDVEINLSSDSNESALGVANEKGKKNNQKKTPLPAKNSRGINEITKIKVKKKFIL